MRATESRPAASSRGRRVVIGVWPTSLRGEERTGMDLRVGPEMSHERPRRRPPASLLLGAAGLCLCVALALLTPASFSRAVLHGWFADAAGAWSLPAAICAFAVFAFLGVPQLALIAAAV